MGHLPPVVQEFEAVFDTASLQRTARTIALHLNALADDLAGLDMEPREPAGEALLYAEQAPGDGLTTYKVTLSRLVGPTEAETVQAGNYGIHDGWLRFWAADGSTPVASYRADVVESVRVASE